MRVRAGLLAWIGVWSLAPVSLALAATPASDAEQQLRKLELEWTAAEINRDAGALGRILDERFVSTSGAGKPVGKADFIREVIGADADRIVSQDLSDQAFVLSGDTAVVTELDTVHALRAGQPYSVVLRITATYGRYDGRWVALAEHMVQVPAPAAATAHFDAERATAAYMATQSTQAKLRSDRYFEGGYWLTLWDFLVGLAVAALLLFTPLSRRMRDFGERVTPHKWLQVALYALLYVVLSTLLILPWSAYEGFFREHQYGMSNQTAFAWLTDQFKELVISLILIPPALAVLYAVVRKSTRNWWLWGALVSIVLLTFQILISPTYLEPVLNKFYPLADGPLKQQLLSMARANAIPVRQIYEFDASKQTTKMSAHVSGLLGTAQVSLNDNLINRAAPEEVEAVLGHEMGHYVLNHQYKGLLALGIIVVVGFAFLSWAFDRLSRRYMQAWGIRGVTDVAGFPLLVALFSVYLFVLTPVLNTVTRNMEIEADAFGLNAARQPDGFAKAALHVSEYRKMQPGPLEEALLYDHPSGWNRIHRAMLWKAENIGAADIAGYDATHHPPGTVP
jgi:STE24 endopeptidase